MQRVTNCLLLQENKVLLLQKPRRNWWVAPGGKMETGESIKESVVREFREETGLYLENPTLKGVFTFVVKNDHVTESEWMMFTFSADHYQGRLLRESAEGKLVWQPIGAIRDLSMAEGDRYFLDYVIHEKGMIFGTFYYTPVFELLSYRLDPS